MHFPRHVTRGSSDGLNQRGAGAQKALFIGIQNRHQGDLGQVQTFSQQINSHQDIKDSGSKLREKFDPSQSVDV